MFDISFVELFVFGTAALVVLGPRRLPGALREMGRWIAKVRRMATALSSQVGIDDVLDSTGVARRVDELRPSSRGGSLVPRPASSPIGGAPPFVSDRSREYPSEGPDAYGSLPEDLLFTATPQLVAAVPPSL